MTGGTGTPDPETEEDTASGGPADPPDKQAPDQQAPDTQSPDTEATGS
jgi:hypothetical protein